jgi:hypothetical protein
MTTKRVAILSVMLGALLPGLPAAAQPLGSFRWQLQPYCNILTLAVVQQGGQYQLDGTDDQCGAAVKASVAGLAFQNPDGFIGFGLTIVTAPGGTPVHVDATIAIATLSGTWRDSVGNSGTFISTPGAGVPGGPRPAGEVLTGHFSQRYVANSGFMLVHGSYSRPLPSGVAAPVLEYVPGAATATCPGIGQATAGRLCIYAFNVSNIASVSFGGGNSAASRRYGFSLDVFPTAPANAGFIIASWAYRVP